MKISRPSATIRMLLRLSQFITVFAAIEAKDMTMSAPARTMDVMLSLNAASDSTQPFSAAASTMAYSPLT